MVTNKFHIIHSESDSHFEVEFHTEDEVQKIYDVDGLASVWTLEECPACKRGEPLDGNE